MKSLIAAVVVVLGLAAANGGEAQAGHGGGHGGGHAAGHGGHGVHVGHGGHVGVGRAYGVNYYRGFYRRTWAVRTWNPIYRTYYYTNPGVPGTFYYSEVDKLYYPIDRLVVTPSGTVVVEPR